MAEVTVPALNANDESYVLIEWLVSDGAWVAAGADLVSIETSKAVTELTATVGGYLRQERPAMASCRPGEVIGHVLAERSEVPGTSDRESPGEPPVVAREPPVVTGPARELAEASGISLATLASLDRSLIRRGDVEALVAAVPGSSAPVPGRLSAHQLAVARTVTRSHETIPAAFTVMKVAAGKLLTRISNGNSGFLGIPELVIKAVADAASECPFCLASVTDDLGVTTADSADIGVTIDVGTGLFVPVIRAADTLTVNEIASQLMRLRSRALHRQMCEADLDGARIVVSLHQAAGVLLAQPIIYPGHVCALSVGAPDYELKLGPAGEISRHDYFYLGISYDHRIINGKEAAAFLTAIRTRLE